MADNTTTRRRAIAAIASVPFAALVVPATARTPGVSPVFAAKLRAYRAAEEAEAEFDEGVYHPAWRDYEIARDAVPHIAVGDDPYSGALYAVQTSDASRVAAARRLVRDVDTGRCRLEPIESLQAHLAFCRRLAAAADQRDAELERLNRLHRVDEYTDHSDRLTEATYAAFDAALGHPAANMIDLSAKLTLIDRSGAHESTEAWAAIMADARRLAEREA